MLTSELGADPMVSELETKFAKFCSAKLALAVNTGNAALQSAVMGVGVKQVMKLFCPASLS